MPPTTAPHEPRRRALALAAFGLIAITTLTVGIVLAQSESSTRAAAEAGADRDRGLPAPGEAGLGGDGAAPAVDGDASAADGTLPEGASVFDDHPGIAGLDPELLAALRAAAEEASAAGIEFVVNSGWRSPAYQDRLLLDAISVYGSEEEAARWVATAETSAHVSGDAVDIGGADAAEWLSVHGAAYGLCQTYGNEPWHFELRPEAPAAGCPAMYADPTEDPRMRG